MNHLVLVVRVLFGLLFVVFGANYWGQWLEQPPLEDEGAQRFMTGLAQGNIHFFEILKSTEVVAGLLILSGVAVPLGLTVLAPIVVMIFAFHAFGETSGMLMAIGLVVAQLFLAWSYRGAFRGVLTPFAKPCCAAK